MTDKPKPPESEKPSPKFNLTPEENRRAYNQALLLTAMDIRAKKVVPFPERRQKKPADRG